MALEDADIFAEAQLAQSADETAVSAASDLHRFACTVCGSAMAYAVGQQQIHCDNCGHTESVETVEDDVIAEYPLADALRQLKLKPLTPPDTSVTCTHCGATSVWDAYRLSDKCPYCSTPIAKLDTENNHLQIEAIVPFSIDKKAAVKLFAEWLGSRWFAPNVLKEMAGHGKQFDGVYIPHWTFDSLTHTNYTGRRGEHYIVYERQLRIVNGEQQMVEVPVTKTRWYHAAGQVRVMFDDVLVLASMLIPKTIVNQLRPWQLKQAKPYTPDYLAGLKADYYQLDLDEAFHVAKQRMAVDINRAIRRDIGGDVQQIHSKQTRYQHSTYKLIMLPVWHSSIEYKGKIYKTVINGQSGKVAGQYPKSALKIALAAVAALVVVGIGLYLFAQLQQGA